MVLYVFPETALCFGFMCIDYNGDLGTFHIMQQDDTLCASAYTCRCTPVQTRAHKDSQKDDPQGADAVWYYGGHLTTL